MRRTISSALACAASLLVCALMPLSADAQSNQPEVDPYPGVPVSTAAQIVSTGGSLFPLSVPVLSSRPSASVKIYLDFSGDVSDSWGLNYSPGTTPAYDIDGDPTTFTQQELDNIHEIWARVSESYSPFNVDVTTIDPGALVKQQSMRVVIGGDGKNGYDTYWTNGVRAGGIGYVGSFVNGNPSTVYVFPKNLANGVPVYTAEAAAHEAGHSFGLYHQSYYDSNGVLQEYNPGSSVEGPFMGVPYFSSRAIWYAGLSARNNDSFAEQQDDVDVIAGGLNGFGYAPDEAGDTIGAATQLVVTKNAFATSGVITQTSDLDYYSFDVSDESNALFNLAVAPFGAMLDGSLALYSADGTLLDMEANPTLGEQIAMHLLPGSYDLEVLSAGNVGDIGQYTLTGLLTPVPEPAAGLILLSVLPLLSRCRKP